MKGKEFIKRYWAHYLFLEKDLLNTQWFLEFDEINNQSFSFKYLQLYQSICSEIEIIFKEFSKFIVSDKNFGNIIDSYDMIKNEYPQFTNEIVVFINDEREFRPWKDWQYNDKTNKYESPNWWKIYNKSKHERTFISPENGLPYYKLLNQENLLISFSALFQLEMYLYERIVSTEDISEEVKVPIPKSDLFYIKGWYSNIIVQGENAYIIQG